MSNHRTAPVALMAAALLLLTLGIANADLKPTNVLNSYDDGSNSYENGNITMWLNNDPQPFYTGIAFDNDIHAGACGPGTSTKWAGDTFVGLYNVDNNPAGAPGFQSTQNWKIVKCSAFAPGVKYPSAGDVLATCDEAGSPEVGKACVLLGTKDTAVPCSTGNCATEIQTKFHLTTDTDCDGNVDEPFLTAGDDICLYWEAVKPPPVTPKWGGNVQVRYNADNDTAGGDKTINFNDLRGPNAVSISSLSAVADNNRLSLGAWAAALLLSATALFLWRRRG